MSPPAQPSAQGVPAWPATATGLAAARVGSPRLGTAGPLGGGGPPGWGPAGCPGARAARLGPAAPAVGWPRSARGAASRDHAIARRGSGAAHPPPGAEAGGAGAGAAVLAAAVGVPAAILVSQSGATQRLSPLP